MNLHHRCQNSVPYCHGTPPTKPASKSAAKAGMLRFFSRVYFSLPFDPFLVHLSCVYSCFCPHPPPSPLTTSLCTLLIPHSHPSFPHPYYLPPPPLPLSPPSLPHIYCTVEPPKCWGLAFCPLSKGCPFFRGRNV